MRKPLIIGGVILAFFVTAHYARWQWVSPENHSRSDRPAIQNDHKTCGTVANVYHDTHDDGQPTFVDLGHDYPSQTFTIIIWEKDRPKFNPPPESWQGERICVTGHIKRHKGTPEIIAYDPNQVRVDQ